MSNATIDRQWTTRLRKRAESALPPEKLLPDTQPSYVSSWIYVFGVATLVALTLVTLSGLVLALKGPAWWHVSHVGHFVNSTHLWLYTFWYQVPPFSTSGNADSLIWGLMMVLTVIMIFVPFIPGVRSIPRRTKVFRLIWRNHYRQ